MTDTAPLQFHVPEPDVRPGGAPDFSNVRIPEAGSVRRPDIDANPESIRDLAYSIIRVLNRNGEAVGPLAGSLDDDELYMEANASAERPFRWVVVRSTPIPIVVNLPDDYWG
jgi:hypothetical protein